MNTLNVASALAGIRISQLDDEFQLKITKVLNDILPGDLEVVPETTGDELKRILQVEVPKQDRNYVAESVVFVDDDVRRFYNEIERCQQAMSKNIAYDDGVKGNFISNMGLMVILFVMATVAMYGLTGDTRGNVTDSKTASVISLIVKGLSNDAITIEKEIETLE